MIPDDGSLAAGETVDVSYCTEPAALPSAAQAATTPTNGRGPWGGSGGGSGSGGSGASDGGGSGDDGGTGTSGSITSNGWGLSWRRAGESYGGECMELTLVNLTDRALGDWWAQVALRGETTVTDSWGEMAAFSFDTPELWLVPPQYDDAPIGARGTVTGTVCLDPMVDLVGFAVYGEPAEDGGDSGGDSGSDVELRGELYDAESGFALRYFDGGATARSG